jgi:hypothetical protein
MGSRVEASGRYSGQRWTRPTLLPKPPLALPHWLDLKWSNCFVGNGMAGQMNLSQDFNEFLSCLAAEEVRFLLVGGYALAAHGFPRFTKDMDVWVACDEGNADRILRALAAFGFGSIGLSRSDLLDPRGVVQLGYPPLRIDLLSGIDGVGFEDAWPRRILVNWSGLEIPVIHRSDLILNKKSTGRLRDLADVEDLERLGG